MSERSEKTYISIHEFISSWEKEIYEFNYLDYFAFLLINSLGNQIEQYFNQNKSKTRYLYIEGEDVGTLAFNIGDTLESFFENNCLGDCNLSCPTRLHEKIDLNEIDYDNHHLHILQLVNNEEIDKKQFLLTDILNYVVLDTLFDFYNYEIGLDLDDSDMGLMHLADFITAQLEIFIETRGQQYLKSPKESAIELFERLVQDSEQDWNELLQAPIDDDPDDAEDWKTGKLLAANIIQEFLNHQNISDSQKEKLKKILNYFKNYLEEYAGIRHLEEVTKEDVEEFYTFWLVRETVLETELSPQYIKSSYHRFFKWLEISFDININQYFSAITDRHFNKVNQAVFTARSYFSENSIVDGILASNATDSRVVSGLFYIEEATANGLFRLRDIHFKNKYTNVQMNLPANLFDLKGMIIDAVIKPTTYGWRLINLEYVFPAAAKPYLH